MTLIPALGSSSEVIAVFVQNIVFLSLVIIFFP